ncbi:hypothetical protein CTH30272_02113 [Allocatenococcus thiocycli]|nr:hypothetical protein CTH30272_02113 [Catenococcus thiocycli]
MIGIITKALLAFGSKLLMSFGSEKLIEWAFFYLAEQIVKGTKTKHDDEFLEKVKEAYGEKSA